MAKCPPSSQKEILAEFKFGDWQSRIQIFITSSCFVWRKSARGAKTEVEVMEEFELESCVRDDHITRVCGLCCWGKYFLQLRGLTFDATLDFSICFLMILLGPLGWMTCMLSSSRSALRKELVQSHSVFTRSDFTLRSFNG